MGLSRRGLFGAALWLSLGLQSSPWAQPAGFDFSSVVQQKLPSVVAILNKQMIRQETSEQAGLDQFPAPFDVPSLPRRTTLGSGFVIRSDGYIVTNNHVIENAASVHVRLSNGTILPGRIVGIDEASDLAVLKVDAELQALAWGDSDRILPGAWTMAIGSPFGFGGTVTVGVLSARSRDLQAGPYDDFLQTDAAINQGNSGGPLFNISGEVIGVNTAIYAPSGGNVGIGFAIPSNTARTLVDRLIENGFVVRGFIGARLQDMTSAIAVALGRSNTKGALVAAVEPRSPASKAGILPGDVITSFDGIPVESAHPLAHVVSSLPPGRQTRAIVERNDQVKDLEITIGELAGPRPRDANARLASAGPSRHGLVVIAVGGLRQRFGLGGETGLLVRAVDPKGSAASNDLSPGDIILSINRQPARSASDLDRAWTDAMKRNTPMLLAVKRGDDQMFVALGPGSDLP